MNLNGRRHGFSDEKTETPFFFRLMRGTEFLLRPCKFFSPSSPVVISSEPRDAVYRARRDPAVPDSAKGLLSALLSLLTAPFSHVWIISALFLDRFPDVCRNGSSRDVRDRDNAVSTMLTPALVVLVAIDFVCAVVCQPPFRVRREVSPADADLSGIVDVMALESGAGKIAVDVLFFLSFLLIFIFSPAIHAVSPLFRLAERLYHSSRVRAASVAISKDLSSPGSPLSCREAFLIRDALFGEMTDGPSSAKREFFLLSANASLLAGSPDSAAVMMVVRDDRMPHFPPRHGMLPDTHAALSVCRMLPSASVARLLSDPDAPHAVIANMLCLTSEPFETVASAVFSEWSGNRAASSKFFHALSVVLTAHLHCAQMSSRPRSDSPVLEPLTSGEIPLFAKRHPMLMEMLSEADLNFPVFDASGLPLGPLLRQAALAAKEHAALEISTPRPPPTCGRTKTRI